MVASNPEKLIPEKIDVDPTFFTEIPILGDLIGEKPMSDVLLALSPALVALLIGKNFLPPRYQFLSFILGGFFTLIGVGILLALPDYTYLNELIADYRHYKVFPSRIRHRRADTETEIDRSFYEADRTTQELTLVDKIHPSQNVIERKDGTVVAAVRIHPMSMVTASNNDWARETNNFANFLNTQLDFPIQIYITTRHFDSEKFLRPYKERRNDPEIANNPILSRYIDHYIEMNENTEADRYMREFYVIIPVSPTDISSARTDKGFDWSRMPIIGGFVSMLTDSGVGRSTKTERKQRQFQEVNERANTIERGLKSNLQGIKAERVTAGEHAILLKEFWEGRNMNDKDAEKFLRTKPLIAGASDAQ